MTLLGIGGVPGVASAQPRHDGHARRGLGQHRDPGSRPAARLRHALRRSRHRQPARPTRRNARKIHIDIDPAEIGKNVTVDVGIVGDLRDVLESARCPASPPASARDWLAAHRRAEGRLGGPRHPEPAGRRASVCGARHQRHLARDRTAAPIVVTDVGQHQMWEAQYYHHDAAALAHHVGRARHDGLRAAGGDRRQGARARRRSLGRSPATAASR